MRYRYLDDFRRGISVFAIFSYGIAVLGTPQCPPLDSFLIRKRAGKFDQNYIDKIVIKLLIFCVHGGGGFIIHVE